MKRSHLRAFRCTCQRTTPLHLICKSLVIPLPSKSLPVCTIHTKISTNNETGACNSSWRHKLESNAKLSDTKWLKCTPLRVEENRGWLKPGLKPCYCYKALQNQILVLMFQIMLKDAKSWTTYTCHYGPDPGPDCLWMSTLLCFPAEYEVYRLIQVSIILSLSTVWWSLGKIWNNSYYSGITIPIQTHINTHQDSTNSQHQSCTSPEFWHQSLSQTNPMAMVEHGVSKTCQVYRTSLQRFEEWV